MKLTPSQEHDLFAGNTYLLSRQPFLCVLYGALISLT